MVSYKLRDKVRKDVRRNIRLFTDIATLLDVTPSYLTRLVALNDPKLTQKAVLKLISDYTGKSTNELTEEYAADTEVNSEDKGNGTDGSKLSKAKSPVN